MYNPSPYIEVGQRCPHNGKKGPSQGPIEAGGFGLRVSALFIGPPRVKKKNLNT